MSDQDAIARQSQPLDIHLVGIGLGHALTPSLHNFVARSIDVPWRLIATESLTISECIRLFRSPGQAGGVVTMPWKGEILQHLDRLDNTAGMLGACNVVYFDKNGQLCGSNTDWVGIEGALRAAGAEDMKESTAAVVGAGGAARAAIYALTSRFGAKDIYVLNRDDDEVARLVRDCSQMGCRILHVKTLEQTKALQTPSLIVGCVPDYAPATPEENMVKRILLSLLNDKGDTGIMLDMCYYPNRQTRNLRLALDCGWRTVSGTQVVGHQVEALWRFWISEERLARLDRDGLWRLLDSAVELNSDGRQALNAEILKQHFG